MNYLLIVFKSVFRFIHLVLVSVSFSLFFTKLHLKLFFSFFLQIQITISVQKFVFIKICFWKKPIMLTKATFIDQKYSENSYIVK